MQNVKEGSSTSNRNLDLRNAMVVLQGQRTLKQVSSIPMLKNAGGKSRYRCSDYVYYYGCCVCSWYLHRQ